LAVRSLSLWGEVMLMITYGELYQFCLVILGVISLCIMLRR